MIKKEMEEEDTCEIVQKLLTNPQTDLAQYQLFRETHNLIVIPQHLTNILFFLRFKLNS